MHEQPRRAHVTLRLLANGHASVFLTSIYVLTCPFMSLARWSTTRSHSSPFSCRYIPFSSSLAHSPSGHLIFCYLRALSFEFLFGFWATASFLPFFWLFSCIHTSQLAHLQSQFSSVSLYNCDCPCSAMLLWRRVGRATSCELNQLIDSLICAEPDYCIVLATAMSSCEYAFVLCVIFLVIALSEISS